MAWLSGADPSAVTFNHRHFGWTFRTIGQGIVGFGIGIAALGQFPAHIMHDPLNGLGRELLAPDLIEYDRAPLERTCLRRRDDDPLDQERCQLTGIKPQHFPEGGKSPGGTWGKDFSTITIPSFLLFFGLTLLGLGVLLPQLGEPVAAQGGSQVGVIVERRGTVPQLGAPVQGVAGLGHVAGRRLNDGRIPGVGLSLR